MSIFGSIMSKIVSAAEEAVGMGGAAPPAEAPASTSTAQEVAGSTSPPPTLSAMGQAQAPVDVEAVLSDMASRKGGGGNWRTSIVDLLKLIDLDSGLNARKELAEELNVHAGADGSAEENIALHKAVMHKLAENGGKVPDSLRS
jgi:hypothetical protein